MQVSYTLSEDAQQQGIMIQARQPRPSNGLKLASDVTHEIKSIAQTEVQTSNITPTFATQTHIYFTSVL